MNILVFNCGSSSLKYKLIDMPSQTVVAGGEAQRIGPPTAEPSRILHQVQGKREVVEVPMRDHRSAFDEVMKILETAQCRPDGVGHRMVHGGARFSRPARIGQRVYEDLEAVADLAPLHNPPAMALIQACLKRYPNLPQVAVFDTAYHATIPEYARTYALPRGLAAETRIRKYGFHGTSHQYVAEQAAQFLNIPMEKLNAVSCHLGSGGASLCAIQGGKSIDNTMGFSPLQGLIMSTRCGDLDPAIPMQMLARANGDHGRVEAVLNKKSGVLGMSGTSADIRDILAACHQSEDRDRIRKYHVTAQSYLWRIRKYLGAYLAVVESPAAVIFTDTIGETVPYVRWSVCTDMDVFGIQIDAHKNWAVEQYPADVATEGSPVRVLVIQTNEELAIAQFTHQVLVHEN
ncbi:MAG: acetate/propionate family kinase [bacterium]